MSKSAFHAYLMAREYRVLKPNFSTPNHPKSKYGLQAKRNLE